MATGEFICGLFFLACGAALLFYNKPLVERSREFQPRNSRAEEGGGDLFNRFLCVLAGALTLTVGLLMMLSSRGG